MIERNRFKSIKKIFHRFFNPNTNPNLKRIMETVFRDLNYLHNPVDIVKFFDRDGFLHYFETLMQSAEKSKDKADLYRNQGNEQYSQKNYVQALELYNQSICWAATGSEQLGMGYANRSAVYLSLKMYDECLKSIELARQSDYPRKIISKLDQREVKCLNEMKSPVMSSKKEFVGLKPELSYPPHEKVPFIANCLDLKVNEKYGRHIVTKTDLKVGDIVAIEQPFCGVVARDIRYNCCANCLEEHDLDLIPCSNCHSAMFCNEQCYTEARSNFHDIECPILRFLMDKYTFGDLPLMMSEEHVGFRLFIMLVKSFGTADELMKFVKDLENREENVFTINHQTNDKFDLFATILKLARNEKHEVVAMKNIIGSTTAFIYKFLLRSTALKEMFKTPEQIEFLIDLLYRLLQIAHQNSLAVHSQRKFYSIMKKKLNRACLGIYPFMSLMNHSCAPNTILHPIRHGFNNIVIISKPIKAGEQLFTSYG